MTVSKYLNFNRNSFLKFFFHKGYLGHFKETVHRNNKEKKPNKYTYKEYKRFKDNAGKNMQII